MEPQDNNAVIEQFNKEQEQMDTMMCHADSVFLSKEDAYCMQVELTINRLEHRLDAFFLKK